MYKYPGFVEANKFEYNLLDRYEKENITRPKATGVKILRPNFSDQTRIANDTKGVIVGKSNFNLIVATWNSKKILKTEFIVP